MKTVRTVGQRVFKKGKIFQCGDYPDKGVSVSVEELRAGNESFAPVPLNIEHWHSVLDGRLGELIAVEFADDGSVFGLISIPKALDDLLDGQEVPVSIEIAHESLAIVGLAFAKFPRVPDAAVFAAFGVEPPGKRKENPRMNWKDLFKAAFSKAVDEMPDDAPVVTPATAPTVAPVVDTATAEQLKAQQDALEQAKSELAELKAQQATEAAAHQEQQVLAASKDFAKHYVQERKILPSQVEAVALQYSVALKSDNTGKACFASDGKATEGDATKALRTMLDAQPQHKWSQDFMSNAQFKAISGDNTDEGISADRKKALMAKTTLGRQATKIAKGANC
jgi:hypothetical protein